MLTRKHFDTKPAFPYAKPNKSQLARLAAWLGQSNHIKASRRKAIPKARHIGSMCDRALALFVPWSIHEYPGWWRWMGAICGIKATSARQLAKSDKRLPVKHAETLAGLCESRAAALLALAGDLRRHAAARAGTIEPRSARMRRINSERSQGLRDRRGRLKPAEDL